jgi:hypothetical protein
MKVRRFVTLTVSALLSAVVPAIAQTISIVPLDPDAPGPYNGTGFANSQTVVSNQNGIFATYIQGQVGSGLTQATWRLVRSVDGGNTFTTVYWAVHGTSAPVIETDRDGNIYLIHSHKATNAAYFRRFLAANNYTNPTELELPGGAAEKFSAVIDESRGRMYYVATNFVATPPGDGTVWFFSIPLDGSTYSSTRLTQAWVGGSEPPFVDYTVNDAHYPHLYLDEHDHLYVAWTNLIIKYKNPVPPATQRVMHSYNYHSIHFMRSRDGAATWENLTGTSITLPVIADHNNIGLTHEVNPLGERDTSTFLWNMIVKQGKAHFWYRASGLDDKPMHYVRFDTVSGTRELDMSPFGGTNYSLNAEHGDCSTRRERLNGTIYCVATTADDDNNPSTPQNDRLAVVVTTDNGNTWQDYAATSPYPNCNECQFGISTARQIADESLILGTFTLEPRDTNGARPLKFFRVPVPTPSAVQFPATVTTSAADPSYPASYAIDNNPATRWVASFTPSVANNNAWIQLDLGSVKEVGRLMWTGASGYPFPAHSPAHYTIAASNDGVNWTTVASRSHSSPVINGDEPIGLNARYLRLTTTKVNDGTGWSLGFSEIYAAGVNPPATSRLPTTNAGTISQAAAYPLGNALDADPNTLFLPSMTAQLSNNFAWVWFDLGSVQPVTRLKWLGAVGWPSPAHSPTDYYIQVSHDFVHWTVLKTRTSPSAVLSGDELLAVTTRYIQFVATKVNDGTGWAMGLFELWAEH